MWLYKALPHDILKYCFAKQHKSLRNKIFAFIETLHANIYSLECQSSKILPQILELRHITLMNLIMQNTECKNVLRKEQFKTDA